MLGRAAFGECNSAARLHQTFCWVRCDIVNSFRVLTAGNDFAFFLQVRPKFNVVWFARVIILSQEAILRQRSMEPVNLELTLPWILGCSHTLRVVVKNGF